MPSSACVPRCEAPQKLLASPPCARRALPRERAQSHRVPRPPALSSLRARALPPPALPPQAVAMTDVVFRTRKAARHHLRALYPQGTATAMNAVRQLQVATAAARSAASGGNKAGGVDRKRKRDQERATVAATAAMPQLLVVKT